MKSSRGIARASALTCTLVAVLLAGCGDNAQDHLVKAKKLIASNDHKGAVIELKNTLQKDPRALEARFLLGRELLQQGDPKNAEIELQKAYDARYEPDTVLPMLVKAQLLQGQTDKVVSQIGTAQLKSPQANAELQSLLGLTKFSQNRMDEAMTAFATAKGLVPDYPDALLGEARIKAARGDLPDARAEVEQVLAKNPKQVEALILKGDIARAAGSPQDATAAYRAALAESPNNFIARLDLASALTTAQQFDEAQKEVDALRKVSPRHPGVAYIAALIAFQRKDYAKAGAEITVSLNAAPNNGPTQLLAGAIATANNEPAQAEQHLRDALKINPGSVYGRKLLTSLYLRQRQPLKAEETLQPVIAAGSSDPAIASLIGEIALMKGDFGNAAKSFDAAAKLNPADANVRTQAAAISFARGDSATGFAELEAASKATTTNPNPDIALVLAHLQRKQFDQALAAWKTLEKRQPDNPMTYNLRAAIDMGRGDLPAARKALDRAVQIQPTYFPAVANLANLDLRDKKVDSARGRYKALLEKDPNSASALLALAQLENANGGSAETVLGLLKQAKRANPTAEQPVTSLVGYYLGKRDPKLALATAQEALASSPNNPRYLEMVGQLMLQTGSVDQAIAAYRKLVTINPESTAYQLRLGQVQLQAGQPEAAMQTFGNALKQQPDSVEIQAAMVGSMIRANRSEDAAKLLAQIKRQAPKSAVVPELEGDVKFSEKQYADAAAAYRKVLAQNPNTNLVVKTYSALALDGRKGDADGFLADWVKAHPKDLQTRLFDADLAMRARDYKRAAANYRAMLEVQPNDPLMLNNLAWALSQDKDPQALAVAEKANAAAPGNPAINDTLGWMLVEQGQTKRGLELLQRANSTAPAQLDIALHLAKAQIKDGRKDAAKTTLESLVKAAPDSAEGKESKELLATL